MNSPAIVLASGDVTRPLRMHEHETLQNEMVSSDVTRAFIKSPGITAWGRAGSLKPASELQSHPPGAIKRTEYVQSARCQVSEQVREQGRFAVAMVTTAFRE